MGGFNTVIRDKKSTVAALAICIAALIAAVFGFFALPEKIFVQLLSSGNAPETSKILFLSVGAVLIAVTSAMCIFTEKSKKWLALEAVLTIAFVGCVVYNYVVL